MVNGAPNQDEALLVIALNVLSGRINPDQWRGLRRLDEDEAAVLGIFNDIRQKGFGKMEVVVLASKLDTIHKIESYKRKDLIKEPTGA